MTDAQSHKSWYLRPGVLLLIAAVLFIGDGALSVWLPYHREQQVIAEVERLGGETTTRVFRPSWIPDAADDRYLWVFRRVSKVNLSNTQISDASLAQLSSLTMLQGISLEGTRVNGASLVHLQELTSLVGLSLRNSQVSDSDLDQVGGLTNLVALSLENTQVSDAGLEHLRGLTNLDGLFPNGTHVPEGGIENLHKALPGCYIPRTPPTE